MEDDGPWELPRHLRKKESVGSSFDPNESFRGVLLCFRCRKQETKVETANSSL
ncbi:hypothetical protein HanHA89_Chr04g0166241 [Helianthus annuus]|nr:hypothetical protein HanHA89_Chr04g0166241 [Helianthus annuus]